MTPEDARELKEGTLLHVVNEPLLPDAIHRWAQAISYFMSGDPHLVPFGDYVMYIRPTFRRRARETFIVVLHEENLVAINIKWLELATFKGSPE